MCQINGSDLTLHTYKILRLHSSRLHFLMKLDDVLTASSKSQINYFNPKARKCFFGTRLHMSLSMISRIICNGISPSVLIASLLGSGLMKNNVGKPRTCTLKICFHINTLRGGLMKKKIEGERVRVYLHVACKLVLIICINFHNHCIALILYCKLFHKDQKYSNSSVTRCE